MLRTISLTRNGKNKFRYGLKKNLSTLTTSSTNKKPISLFIESNPFHYKLPLETHKQKINTKVFSERKYFNKRLMDSIENFSNRKFFKNKKFKFRPIRFKYFKFNDKIYLFQSRYRK